MASTRQKVTEIPSAVVKPDPPPQSSSAAEARNAAYDEQWDIHYQELVEYYNEHGNTLIPVRSGTLGKWVSRQRSERHSMSERRKNKLNEINFAWHGMPKAQQQQEQQKQQQDKEETKPSRRSSRTGGSGGGGETKKKEEKKKIDDDDNNDNKKKEEKREPRIFAREGTGTQNDIRWEGMYMKLKSYYEKHGDCLVPVRYKIDPTLGKWVSRQRETLPVMPAKRRAMLEELGFVWSAKRGTIDAPPPPKRQQVKRKPGRKPGRKKGTPGRKRAKIVPEPMEENKDDDESPSDQSLSQFGQTNATWTRAPASETGGTTVFWAMKTSSDDTPAATTKPSAIWTRAPAPGTGGSTSIWAMKTSSDDTPATTKASGSDDDEESAVSASSCQTLSSQVVDGKAFKSRNVNVPVPGVVCVFSSSFDDGPRKPVATSCLTYANEEACSFAAACHATAYQQRRQKQRIVSPTPKRRLVSPGGSTKASPFQEPYGRVLPSESSEFETI